jgi:hypothetical protein
LQNQVFLGSETYVKEIFKKIDLKKDLSEMPTSQRREKAKPLSWYEEQAKQEMKVSRQLIIAAVIA